MSRDRRLFHFASPAAWAEAKDAPAPPRAESLDREGFVHLSLAHQLEGTLGVHFAGVPEVLLVELDPSALAEELRFEASRGGEDFPHLYRPLGWGDVLRTWHLLRDPGGLRPPGLADDPEDDRPRGTAHPPFER